MNNPDQDALKSVLGSYHSESFTGYLPKPAMMHGGVYIICARNAYAGIWDAERNGFFIARWKLGLRLFVEYHWDESFYTEGVLCNRGTAKPMRLIGSMIDLDKSTWVPFLIKAEEDNPIVPGIDTIAQKFESNKRWVDHLSSSNGHEPEYKNKSGDEYGSCDH